MTKRKSKASLAEKQWAARQLRAETAARIAAVKKASKRAALESKRELTAQWRVLKKLGVIQTKITPAQKRLTKYQQTKIKKAFKSVQQMGHYTHGHVERPLVKTKKGNRVSFTLAPHFQFIKTKRKPKTKAGVIKTLKGLIVEKETPHAKVRLLKSGAIRETDQYSSGGITIDREGLTGAEIIGLIDAIKAGKFKIPKHSLLSVFNFGWTKSQSYAYDDLDKLVLDFEKYEMTMGSKVFEAWLSMTEITLQHWTPQKRVK